MKKNEFHDLDDKELVDLLIEGRPKWPEVYEELLVNRYGGVVEDAKKFSSNKWNGKLETKTAQAELLLHLRGKDGSWKNLRSWQVNKGPLKGWLFITAYNLYNSLFKKEAKHEKREVITDETHTKSGSSNTLMTSARADHFMTIQELLRRIGEECSQILKQKYYFEMSDLDIGKMFSRSREWANRKRQSCLKELNKRLLNENLRISDFAL